MAFSASFKSSSNISVYSAGKPSFPQHSSTDPEVAGTVAMGMSRAIEDYLAHLRDLNRSPLTVRRYGELLQRFQALMRSELHKEEVAVGDADKALVVLFVREGGEPGSSAAASTRNSRLAALRGLFEYLVAENRLGRDPSEGLAFAKLPKRSPTFLNEDEFGRLCATVEKGTTEHYLRRDLAILVTLWHTGLRLAELLSLDLAQIDIEAERFRQVRRKGGHVVDVHFNVEVTIALRRWLWQRRHYARADQSPALFLSDRGNRLSARAVEDLVTNHARTAGLAKRVTPHTLRHSTATALIRAGNGIEVVAEVLDHRSLDTTRGYVHLVGEQVHAAVASLAAGAGRRSK
jgi:integrase/recombinase XerC